MKRIKSAIAIGITYLFVGGVNSQACSDLIVGKKASVDGSIIISYAADSHTLYGELYHWPAKDWGNGSMRQILEWDTNKPLGFIPESGHTYNVIGNMNEYQLAITESTWGGRKECIDPNGMIDYGSLIYITLQKTKTARDAIKYIANLVKNYGYASSGESFTIADKNEVWIMEIIGKGPKDKGAVWVAIRIPDNAISGHANQSRIHQIPFADKENCIYAEDVVDVARKLGFYKGSDKDFDFQEAFNPYSFVSLRGCEARVWDFFRKHCKGMEKYTNMVLGDIHTKDKLPLYVIPDKKLSVQDVQQAMRSHFEGCVLDMTNDPGAGAYKSPYRWRPMTYNVDGNEYMNERAISTQQTGFVLVAQLRNWLPDPIGGVLWFGVDDANMTVFTPMYASITSVPECYKQGNGDMMHFSWTSAFWIHNWVANMAYNRYEPMIKDIRKVQNKLESYYFENQKSVEDKALKLYEQSPQMALSYLTEYCSDIANEATNRWKRLGEYLLVKFMDGNEKKEENGHFKDNGHGLSEMPNFPGYDKWFYENIVKSTGDHLKIKGNVEH